MTDKNKIKTAVATLGGFLGALIAMFIASLTEGEYDERPTENEDQNDASENS